jgi:ParB family chromosome partitioning protein
MQEAAKRRGLGRGLSALIPGGDAPPPPVGEKRGMLTIGIEHLHPNPTQPRTHFDADKLEELAQSIRENGLIQPIIVRKQDDGYQIIAGERRWRAAQKAGLQDVPVVVKDLADQDILAIALIENIQRADLNPIEEALAFERLLAEHQFTQEALAKRVGKDRTTVTNSLRLLKLPEKVRAMVVEGALSMGHARALLGLEDGKQIEKAAQQLASGGGSVRDAERLVAQLRSGADTPAAKPAPSAAALAVIDQLQAALGTRVRLSEKEGKGKIEVDFHSLAELDRLIDRMTRR